MEILQPKEEEEEEKKREKFPTKSNGYCLRLVEWPASRQSTRKEAFCEI